MLRIFVILCLFVLLAPQKHSLKSNPVTPGALIVSADPLPLNDNDPAQVMAGPLRWLGSWELTSTQKEFGSISSMVIAADGSLLALSDSGTLMGFRVGAKGHVDGGRQFIAPLPVRPEERSWPAWKWDSESMVHDPVSGNYWVGFELINWICRYSPGFIRVEDCVSRPEMWDWPKTGGAEAMVRLPDGRFLVFSEKKEGPDGGNEVLLFANDPVDPATPTALRLSYRPPQGYVPTDAVAIDGNRLIVLNRRVTLAEGFTGSLALVDLPPLRPGAILNGRQIVRLAPPLLSDNYEALALSREGGKQVIWVASDDNFEFFQRTLLLKFALPDTWPTE
jgi:hypothetical protein